MPTPKDQYKLEQLIKDLKEKDVKDLRKRFKYLPKKEKPVDWSSYTQAQVMEINNTLLLIKNMAEEAYQRVKHIAECKNKVGAPYEKPFEDKAKAILVQQLFCVSDRVAEGLIILFKEKLGITEHITAKGVERAYEEPCAVAIVQERAMCCSHSPGKSHVL